MLHVRAPVIGLLVALSSLTCTGPSIPEGLFECGTAADCPGGWSCVDGLCWSYPGAPDGSPAATDAPAAAADGPPLPDGAPPTDAPPPDAPCGGECQDDGNPCNGVERCENEACVMDPPPDCTSPLACDPESGQCACPSGTLMCAGTCHSGYECCPGETNGGCGRCGTWKCDTNGHWFCEEPFGVNCDPGWSCTGTDCDPDCPVTQHRECDSTCHISGCW